MTLTVTPNPLIQGESARVCIHGGPPSSTATVDINNGGDQADSLPIDLDASGNGCSDWPVPTTWNLAKFNYGGQEVVRYIFAPASP